MEDTDSNEDNDRHPGIPEGPDLSDEAGWPEDLTENHRLYLCDRAVSPQVAAGRGYRSVTARGGSGMNNLTKFGWGRAHVIKDQIDSKKGLAALVIPLYDATREQPSTHQCRLDDPRLNDESGKVIKFEAPHNVKRGPDHGDLPADVHPWMSSKATDSDSPLILTEGIPKADALLTAALAEQIDVVPVALTGVTMGYEVHDPVGGSMQKTYTITPSLARIVEGRETVYLCWDSDWADNKMVRGSLARTGQLLRKAGVDNVIFLGIPNDGDANKTGVDDWLAAGGQLADLLTNHQMPEPDLEAEDQADPVNAYDKVYEVDTESRRIWGWEMRRIGSDPKPRPVQEIKLNAVGLIVDEVSDCRIVDHILRPDAETYTVRLEWFEERPEGRRPHSKDIEVLASDFSDVHAWLSPLVALSKLRISAPRNDQFEVSNTIAKRTADLVATGDHRVTSTVNSATTGWYLEPSDDYDHKAGWRYVHGHGWIGSPKEIKLGETEHNASQPGIVDLEPVTSDSAKVIGESEARYAYPMLEGDLDDISAAWRQWFDDWVLGGVVDRLIAEDPKRFTPRNAEEREHFQDLKLRLALGALIVARSLLPGTPAMGTPYLVGPPSAGKTLLARVWTSCFGERFGERPYLSFSSTSAGVEVKLADARNMVALVDDFRPSGNEIETMTKVVDQIARGAYDGAVKSRSTRDLKAMEVPQISGSVVLTGEELPTQGSASNSTIQRLIVLRIRAGSDPAYEMMSYLARENTRPQQTATGFMIGVLARMLDEAVDVEESTPIRKATKSAQKVASQLSEWQELLTEDTVNRTLTSPTARPSERTKTVIKDLLLGGSLLMHIAHELGVISSPKDEDRVVKALTTAASWALSETAQIVSDTSPSNNIRDAVTTMLGHGSGHLVTAEGNAPADVTARTWGWTQRADGPWEKHGDHVGFVVRSGAEIVVALNPQMTAKALRFSSGDRTITSTRIQQQISSAMDESGEPILAKGAGSHDPRRRVTINGQTQKMLLVRPEAVGVNISSLAPEAEPKSTIMDSDSEGGIENIENLEDIDFGTLDMTGDDIDEVFYGDGDDGIETVEIT